MPLRLKSGPETARGVHPRRRQRPRSRLDLRTRHNDQHIHGQCGVTNLSNELQETACTGLARMCQVGEAVHSAITAGINVSKANFMQREMSRPRL